MLVYLIVNTLGLHKRRGRYLVSFTIGHLCYVNVIFWSSEMFFFLICVHLDLSCNHISGCVLVSYAGWAPSGAGHDNILVDVCVFKFNLSWLLRGRASNFLSINNFTDNLFFLWEHGPSTTHLKCNLCLFRRWRL